MCRIKARLNWLCMLLVLPLAFRAARAEAGLLRAPDPSQVGPCAVSSQTVQIGGDLKTYVYYPSSSTCSARLVAPYAGIAWAHGFSMFGMVNMAAGHAGDAEHLASWGYVVAVPVLPDDAEQRVTDVRNVLTYLATQTATPGSFLYQRVDANRLAVAGHSFGGATVLMVAARDPRVKAVLSMDPVYHQGGPWSGEEPAFWDPQAEAPNIQAATCILGAPSSTCNSEADYAEIYPYVGATHKAMLLIAGASHCDFMDPGYGLCSLVCNGDTDPARTLLTQKYTTAWFNYYLRFDVESYDYLYGVEAKADVAAGHIVAQWDTAPRALEGQGMRRSAGLRWELYDHPMVAGYSIYRRLPDQSYAAAPYAQVGPVSTYLDDGLTPGQVYYYTVRSRDPAGNEHPATNEVQVTIQGDITPTASPSATSTSEATPTVSATPTGGATPTASATPTRTTTATAPPIWTPTATATATPTPTRGSGPGPCRLYLPALLVGVAGVRGTLSRQAGVERRADVHRPNAASRPFGGWPENEGE